MFEPWFMWAVTGFICIGLEMLLPGFVIFFFGVGGLITALVCLVPFISGLLWLQILLFVVFSSISLIFLRRRFTRIFGGTVFNPKKGNTEDDGIGKIADVIETAGPVIEGRVKFMGTTWKAHTRTGECAAGTRVKILAREGMTYIVEPAVNDAEGVSK
jgi:inner membrane protein